jgi:hypothetical protein
MDTPPGFEAAARASCMGPNRLFSGDTMTSAYPSTFMTTESTAKDRDPSFVDRADKLADAPPRRRPRRSSSAASTRWSSASRGAGIGVRWDDEIPTTRRCFVEDPFGNRIELIEE